MLKTFALRSREVPLTIYGPRGLDELFVDARRIFGRLTYPVDDRRARAGRSARARRLRDRLLRRSTTASPPSATGWSSTSGRDGSTSRRRTRLGVPDGRERGLLQRGEERDASGRARGQRRRTCSARRAPVERSCSRGTRRRQRRSSRRPRAPTSSSTRRRSSPTSASAPARPRHSTAGEAALVAREAGVKLLALTHVSTRYFGHQVVEEATQLFPATVVPRDFDLVTIPFPERGEPELVRSGARTRQPERTNSIRVEPTSPSDSSS